ncbi:MAG: hypothetical protein LQ338_005454 [Usnochroma carphineum]|nr:MAG: hypothetical protein LQ338_005454 [Usnochroma carphineum]
MAKEKAATDPEEKRLKKEKEKKRSETDGVHKSKKDKSDKKKDKSDSKKEKKRSRDEDGAVVAAPITEGAAAAVKGAEAEDVIMTTQLLNTLEAENPGSVAIKDQDGDVEMKVKQSKPLLVGALVPFANPLADEKAAKKVLKGVKKAAKHKTLRRGVKEVVKALRKSSHPPPNNTTASTSSSNNLPPAIVILAADISPMDVISHLPVLCEDHGIPYVFVTSRAELGAASSTKRPTSVVMVGRDVPRGKEKRGEKGKDGKGEEEDGEKEKGKEGKQEEGWEEGYRELVKVVVKAGKGVRV